MSETANDTVGAQARGGSASPRISVVIPTYRRETRLAFALDGLAAQSLSRDAFEVIVVRAGEGEALTSAPGGLDVRFLSSPRAGAAAQRNVGWRAARAPLIAFLDDDCRPAPEWLQRMLAAGDGSSTVIQGRTEADPDEQHLNWGLARTIDVSEPSGWYQTCNIAYPRPVLERTGGFDERFPGAYGEDTDLALRAIERGATVAFAADAAVWHAVHPRTLAAAVRDAGRRGVVAIVVKRHPVHRNELYLRIFFDWRHAKLLLAIIGLVALRRRPLLAAACCAPYLEQGFDWGHSPRRSIRNLVHLAPRTAVDLAEILVVVRSAIRHRVLIL